MDVVLDALPYIDFEYNDPAMKAQVDALVKEEMDRSTLLPSDYLDRKPHLKMPEFKFVNSVFWEAECARLASGSPAAAMDVARYRCEPPKIAFTDAKTGKPKPLTEPQTWTESERLEAITAWTKAVLNAQAQLQHQTERLLNLELLKKFGGMSWKTHNEHLLAIQQSIDNSVISCKKKI